ncbi:MAG: T9SS type A sorting domain-containing protein [Bacteroidetes bacterium]|nr:T9SS type A sorting domain-containing protein [Bacteroidota bacterium]MBR3091222.1 T9SS type A sorting domain-containing protein [Bacteroidota bacterium]
MKRIKNTIIILVYFIFCNDLLFAATEHVFIDTVYSVNWGSSQNFGRSEKYFPMNIFGPPSSTATKYVPAATEDEVCSLGKGGEIIVGCKNHYIVNGEGVDFIIFENVLVNTANTKVFVEPAIISVSQDGENFVEFPFNSNTFEGLAGLNWTNGGADPFDYSVSGGDGFDLSILGLDTISYIKIKDTALIASTLDKSHRYYSPIGMLSGFDLDAISIVYASPKNSSVIYNKNEGSIINCQEDANYFICNSFEKFNINVYDVYGQSVLAKNNINQLCIDKSTLANTIYFLVITTKECNYTYKIVKCF